MNKDERRFHCRTSRLDLPAPPSPSCCSPISHPRPRPRIRRLTSHPNASCAISGVARLHPNPPSVRAFVSTQVTGGSRLRHAAYLEKGDWLRAPNEHARRCGITRPVPVRFFERCGQIAPASPRPHSGTLCRDQCLARDGRSAAGGAGEGVVHRRHKAIVPGSSDATRVTQVPQRTADVPSPEPAPSEPPLHQPDSPVLVLRSSDRARDHRA